MTLPRPWEVYGTTDGEPLLPPDHPLWDAMQKRNPAKPAPDFADDKQWLKEHIGRPRLWDEKPDSVVHIAGACLLLFNMFMRQRCDWCGKVLVEYDLRRVAVPVGQDPMPASWPPGKLVRVDGTVSAVIENPQLIDGWVQLPPDSCAFDPKTQIGA